MHSHADRRGFSLNRIMSAVRMVQTIHSVQAQHYAQFGKYADPLAGRPFVVSADDCFMRRV